MVLLAPQLTEATAEGLLGAAMDKTKAEIEQMLAERFPRPDMLTWVAEMTGSSGSAQPGQHAPGRVEEQPTPESVSAQHAPGRVGDGSRVKPLSSGSFALQLTMSRSTHDKLRHAQELLGHQVASGDVATVLDRALDALIERLEKRKFAATRRPGCGQRRETASPRHIPAHVKRMVLERDGSQCTFVSETGHRCPARSRLEFDHVLEVARGGEATVSGIRLLCRAHNVYGAESTFGAEFMRHKRIAAAEARAIAQARTSAARAEVDAEPAVAKAPATAARAEAVESRTVAQARATAARAEAAAETEARDVTPWLRRLGFSVSEARIGAAGCEHIPDASLEQRVRVALSCVGVRGTRMGRAGEGLAAAAAPSGAVRGRDGP